MVVVGGGGGGLRISFDDFDKYDGGENEHDDGDFSFNQFLTFGLNSEQGGCNVPARNFRELSHQILKTTN